jgi:methylated-DNA-[protein]-cysteine S-methyltransferase
VDTAADICETASMRYASRVTSFETRMGKCALRVIAGADAVEEVQLHPAGEAPCECDEDQPLVREALRQLAAYFAGRLTAFDLPLDMKGTEFQRRVWSALRDIPYGKSCSYGELARAIGRPAAVRAVGAANGRNPIAIVVPCHRVIGASGKLVGYGGGLPLKQMLLGLEADYAERLRQAAAR